MEVRIKDAEAGSTLGQRKTTDGSYVLKDAVVLEYKTPSGEMVKLRAPIEGVVTFDRAAKKGAEMVQDMLVARIEPCQHAIVIKDMCATCGRDLREKNGRAGQRREDSTANVSMIHHVPELIVSDDLAKEIGSADLKNVLSSRKLVLLVDLDQTIIHTTNRPFKVDPNMHSDIHTYKMFGTEYHTKLRPYTHEFLEHMSALFEMHIITYGQRQYAHKIAEILDPKKTLFAQRILSRDELFSAQHKTRNLRALFPCGDQLIAIIDDRADVWQFSEALIQVVLEYKTPSGEMVKLRAPIEGVVTFDRAAKKGAEMVQDMLVARIEPCQHAIVIKDMCATCGRDLRERNGRAGQRREDSTANVSMIHHVPELIVSDDLAKEIGSADLKNVLSSRKLVLLVDLDQTIIHTTNRPFKVDPNMHSDIHTYKMFGTEYHTKLRPYTHEFLEHMSALFEMHIITYGQRQYAHKIAEVKPYRFFKEVGDINAPAGGSKEGLLPIDVEDDAEHDRTLEYIERMLTDIHSNFYKHYDKTQEIRDVKVKPYRFFKEVGDINAPAGGSKEGLLPIDVENDAEHDRTLEYIERMLTDIHSNFYKHYDKTQEIRDVKVVISYLKKQILRGLVVVLSGVVPLGVKPEHSEAYRLCVQFGAVVADQVTEQTTHLIAVRWGTTKVMAAFKMGIPIVTPHWLYACVEKLTKVDEKEFELTKDSKPPEGRPLGGKIIPELTSIDAMKKETIAAMEHEVHWRGYHGLDVASDLDVKVDEVLSEGDDSDEEEEEVLKRRLNGGDGSGDEDDEIEKELAKKRARWEREGNFDAPEDELGEDNPDADADDSFCEGTYDETSNCSTRQEERVMADEEETRDIPYDDEDDEEIEDMAALIERQVSHEE
ncbi:BRCA1 protein [Ancylostoma caninum]|uniref:RNA polymerase II subunit A C-terminal domain phosphatase n=1 Tax=Ancylostoma caninum TaxID=29170 RepID=A0A368G1T9_ANCCA|nr:BRCA1 protein [Ancylostoma caninum]